MRIRLHLRLIRVLEVLVDEVDELVVKVAASTRSASPCPRCGFRCWRVHDGRLQKVRDLPVSGRRTTLVWVRRRFVCDDCGARHLENHLAFEGPVTACRRREGDGYQAGRPPSRRVVGAGDGLGALLVQPGDHRFLRPV